jgi:hypothetical protein
MTPRSAPYVEEKPLVVVPETKALPFRQTRRILPSLFPYSRKVVTSGFLAEEQLHRRHLPF